jgi:uncharacterized protein (TIGR02611 family)
LSGGIRVRVGRQRERTQAKKKAGIAYRVAVATVGVAVTVLGVALLPLPGPGWLVIFAGLGILAREFVWARRLLDFAKDRVGRWSDWVRRQSLAVRSGLGLTTLAAMIAAAYGYVAWRGVPDWIPGIG